MNNLSLIKNIIFENGVKFQKKHNIYVQLFSKQWSSNFNRVYKIDVFDLHEFYLNESKSTLQIYSIPISSKFQSNILDDLEEGCCFNINDLMIFSGNVLMVVSCSSVSNIESNSKLPIELMIPLLPNLNLQELEEKSFMRFNCSGVYSLLVKIIYISEIENPIGTGRKSFRRKIIVADENKQRINICIYKNHLKCLDFQLGDIILLYNFSCENGVSKDDKFKNLNLKTKQLNFFNSDKYFVLKINYMETIQNYNRMLYRKFTSLLENLSFISLDVCRNISLFEMDEIKNQKDLENFHELDKELLEINDANKFIFNIPKVSYNGIIIQKPKAFCHNCGALIYTSRMGIDGLYYICNNISDPHISCKINFNLSVKISFIDVNLNEKQFYYSLSSNKINMKKYFMKINENFILKTLNLIDNKSKFNLKFKYNPIKKNMFLIDFFPETI